PTAHSAISFSPGQAGSDPTYGHVVFVEQVKSDGSILISEANAKGLGVVSYRTFDKATANQFTYVIGK
ncbi:CHAP domain-containing protein, partial [Schaalia georgiae]